MTSRPVSPFSFAPTTPNIRPVSRQSFISTLAPARVSVVENEDVILISRLATANSEDAGQRPAETQKHGEEVEIPVRDAIRPASRASSRQSRRQRVISAASSRISLRSGAGGEERQLGKRKLSVWSRGSAANLPYTAEEGGKDGGKTMGKANWEYEFEDDEELEQAMDEDYERYLKKLTDLRLKQRRSWLLSKAKEEVGLRILPKPNLPINRPAPPLYPLHSPYSRPTSALSSHEHRPTSPLSQYSEDTRSNGPGRRMSDETSLSYGTSSMGPRTPYRGQRAGSSLSFYAESSRHGHASNASDSSHGHTKNGRPSTSLGFHGAGIPPPSPAMSPSSFHGIYSTPRRSTPKSSRGSQFLLNDFDDPEREEYLSSGIIQALTDDEGSLSSDHQFVRKVRFPDEEVGEVGTEGDETLQEQSITAKLPNGNAAADGPTPRSSPRKGFANTDSPNVKPQRSFSAAEKGKAKARQSDEFWLSNSSSSHNEATIKVGTGTGTSILDYLKLATQEKRSVSPLPGKVRSDYEDVGPASLMAAEQRKQQSETGHGNTRPEIEVVRKPSWLRSKTSLRDVFGAFHKRSQSSVNLHTPPRTEEPRPHHSRSQSWNLLDETSRHRTQNSIDDPILRAVMKAAVNKRREEDVEKEKAARQHGRNVSSQSAGSQRGRGAFTLIQRMARRGRSSVDSSHSNATAATLANTSGGDTTLVEAPTPERSPRELDEKETENLRSSTGTENLRSSTGTNATMKVKRRSRHFSGIPFSFLQSNSNGSHESVLPVEDPNEWVQVQVEDVDPNSPDVDFNQGEEELWLFTGKAAESVKKLREKLRPSVLPQPAESIGKAAGKRRKRWRRVTSGEIRIGDEETGEMGEKLQPSTVAITV